MDRQHWMYETRRTSNEYLRGVREFMEVAVEDMTRKGVKKLICPCVDCGNNKLQPVEEVRCHLIMRGFKSKYTNWYWHGEDRVDDHEVSSVPVSGRIDVDNVESTRFDCNENVENLDDPVFENFDDVPDNENFENNNIELDELMHDVEGEFVDYPNIFENMSADSKKPLFPNCTKYTKLSAIFKLFNLKAKNGWSDKSFTSLLELLGDMLPENNELPLSTYQARKMLCPLTMAVDRIHACPNDCILYRNQFKDRDSCPTCGTSRYKPNHEHKTNKKRPAAKVVFYLPIEPRIRRLFLNPRDAALLRWHYDNRKNDGIMRHPADSDDWKKIDMLDEFGDEPRNLRMGLCTDGMSPYGAFSSQKTTWPVFLCVYNLPPWVCMKRKYLMMPLLISGPKQPGNDIDVYLAPLVEDLIQLWHFGIDDVYDAHGKETFTCRVAVLWTINDYPAYGNLSGHRVKGKKACPTCGSDTCTTRLSKCCKDVYLGHRRFLPADHKYRGMRKAFNGQSERRPPPKTLSGHEVLKQVDSDERLKGMKFGKTKKLKADKTAEWNKRSIFWDLPYWPYLEVRHCLDVMHIVKNITESLLGFLGVYGKAKDGLALREDMVLLGIFPDLAPEPQGDRTFLPPAKYTLSKEQRTIVLQCLKSIKVPSGYSSNISSKVSMNDLKLIGLKSHDCHVLMTQLLPVALRAWTEIPIRRTITKLCFFFNSICSKEIDPETFPKLQTDLVETICDLERYFPPSFFDIMVHLSVHLVREIEKCGPVFLRYMYPFERAMGVMKRLVKSRSRPEGNIVETYVAEEAIEFVSDYLEGVEPVGLPKSRYEGRLQGVGTIGFKSIGVTNDLRQKAHLKVLQHLAVVTPFIEEHTKELRLKNPRKPESWISEKHKVEFTQWLRRRVRSSPDSVSDTVRFLADGPSVKIYTYQGYEMNGFIWYTKKQDSKSTSQNSGVTVLGVVENDNVSDSYYGWIEEIWELDYFSFRVPVFKCKWIDNDGEAVKKDRDGFTVVDHNKTRMFAHDPFILASQAKQVSTKYYIFSFFKILMRLIYVYINKINYVGFLH